MRRCSSRSSDAVWAGTCTRSRTTWIRGRCKWASGGGSIGSQRALGRATTSFDEIDASLVGLVDRVARRLRAAVAHLPNGGAATAVRRLHARDALAHDAAADRVDTGSLLAIARALLVEAAPLIERGGLTLVGVALANLDDDDGRAARAAVRPHRSASTPRSTRSKTASDRPPSVGRDYSAATPASPSRCCPTDQAGWSWSTNSIWPTLPTLAGPPLGLSML